jgi:hypothetical protein
LCGRIIGVEANTMQKESQPEPLVEQNIKSVSIFAILNLVLAYTIFFGLPNTQSLPSLLNALLTSVTAMSIAGIMVVIISGVASPLVKARIVEWFEKYPMPGYRAFTAKMLADPRINREVLKKGLHGFPEEGITSNEKWYVIYKRHENAPSVMQAQKAYLLTIEMSFIAFIAMVLIVGIEVVLLLVPTFHPINKPIELLPFVGLFVVQFLVIAWAANTYGINFVRNVLAEESAQLRKSSAAGTS